MKINANMQIQTGYQGSKLKKAEGEAGGKDRVELGSQPLDVTPDLKDLKSGLFGLGSGDGCKDIFIIGELALGTAIGSGMGLICSGIGWGASALGGAPAGLATAAVIGGVMGYLDKSAVTAVTLGASTALGSQFGPMGLVYGTATAGVGIGLVKKGIVKDGI